MSFLEKGNKLGKYELVDYISSGATAEVWSCKDSLKKTYAIKVFSPQLGLDQMSILQLKNVYANTKDINHENILVPFDFSVYKNRAFFVFDTICEGSLTEDFKQRWIDNSGGDFNSVQSGLFTEKELAEMIFQVSLGLKHLHESEGKVHLDMKPANILYTVNHETGGRHYLIHDLDISVDLRKTIMRVEAGGNTGGGFGMAPGYAAPEQFDDDYQPTSAADIFSLGVSVFELASGFLPGGSGSYGRELTIKSRIPRLKGDYSPEFKELVAACMQYDQRNRPSAEFLARAAEVYVNGGSWAKVNVKEPFSFSFRKIAATFLVLALGCAAFFLLGGLNGNSEDLLTEATELMEKGGKANWEKALDIMSDIPNDQASNAVLIQKTGAKKIIDTYSEIGVLTKDGVRVESSDGLVGFVEVSGVEKIPIEYHAIGEKFSYGFIPVSKDDYSGFIDSTGKEIVKPEYKGIARISEDRIGTIGSKCFDLTTGRIIKCKN